MNSPNLPNLLTLSRIGLTCLFVLLLFLPAPWAKGGALTLFALACLTDWLDGLLARRRNQQTPFGALMDPIADKILVLSALLAFVQLRLIPAWMVLVIVVRESLITGVRLRVRSRGRVLPALRLGKHKTVWQMVAITVILLLLWLGEAGPGWDAPWATLIAHTPQISYAVMLVPIILTVASGAQFLWAHRRLLRDRPAQ